MSVVDIWFEGLSLPVAELERSIAFYESLGFAVEIRTDRFGLLQGVRGHNSTR